MNYARFNLFAFINKQIRFSSKTFGPRKRLLGVIDRIKKELIEVEASEGKDVEEWADVIILAIDGAWRAGHSSRTICVALDAKLKKNIGRKWPDWRTTEPGKAIEHVRDKEEIDRCQRYIEKEKGE